MKCYLPVKRKPKRKTLVTSLTDFFLLWSTITRNDNVLSNLLVPALPKIERTEIYFHSYTKVTKTSGKAFETP